MHYSCLFGSNCLFAHVESVRFAALASNVSMIFKKLMQICYTFMGYCRIVGNPQYKDFSSSFDFEANQSTIKTTGTKLISATIQRSYSRMQEREQTYFRVNSELFRKRKPLVNLTSLHYNFSLSFKENP